MSLDRLDAMRTFVEIVDAGSFSVAATRLGVSVPAVSRRLVGFEARIGARLLERTTRQLALTEPGRRYYKTAKRILDEIATAEADFDPNVAVGILRLCTPEFFGRSVIAPLLPAFLERHRKLRVELLLTKSGDHGLIDADVKIEIGRPTPPRTGCTLASFRNVLCASLGYLQRMGTPRRPTDLLSHDCILDTGSERHGRWPVRQGGQDNFVRVGGRLACDDPEAVLAALLAGAGIARVPSFQVREHVRAQRVRVLLEEFEPPPAAVHVVGSERALGTPRLGALIDHLAEHVDDLRLSL